MARPTKSEADRAGYTLAIRLTPSDHALLEGLVALNRRALERQGIVATLTAADVLRGLLRHAAAARGLRGAPVLPTPTESSPPVTEPTAPPPTSAAMQPKASAAERTAPLPFDAPTASSAKSAEVALKRVPAKARRTRMANVPKTTDLDAASVRARLNAFLHDSATPRSAFAKRVGVEAPHLAAFLAARRDLSDAQRAAIDAALKKG